MVAKNSSVTNIRFDSAGINAIRPGLSADQWEAGVVTTINTLNTGRAQSSRLILAALTSTGRTIMIVPVAAPAPGGLPQAVARPDNASAATPAGQPFLGCNPASPLLNQPVPGIAPGTGAGSNVNVRFAGQDTITAGNGTLGLSADEVLLHELVHALRQARGQSHCESIRSGLNSIDNAPGTSNNAQFYDTLEEFVAIVISNIYRSEIGKSGLRRDHSGAAPLNHPLTNARSFSQAWTNQMQRIKDDMGLLTFDLGQLNIAYNPIREFLIAKNIL